MSDWRINDLFYDRIIFFFSTSFPEEQNFIGVYTTQGRKKN